MSHFTTIKTLIRDIAALKAACAELGLEVIDHAEARGYGANRIHGDHVIKLKGPYDVALNRLPDGSYAMNADLWNGHVENELGRGFGRLKQLYGVHKATQEARRKGMHIRRRQDLAQQEGGQAQANSKSEAGRDYFLLALLADWYDQPDKARQYVASARQLDPALAPDIHRFLYYLEQN